VSATDPSKPPTNSPGSLDDPNTWRPPHVEPVQHDDPGMTLPDVKHDLGPDAQPGGKPSTS
jgi:hypothetical protein